MHFVGMIVFVPPQDQGLPVEIKLGQNMNFIDQQTREIMEHLLYRVEHGFYFDQGIYLIDNDGRYNHLAFTSSTRDGEHHLLSFSTLNKVRQEELHRNVVAVDVLLFVSERIARLYIRDGLDNQVEVIAFRDSSGYWLITEPMDVGNVFTRKNVQDQLEHMLIELKQFGNGRLDNTRIALVDLHF